MTISILGAGWLGLPLAIELVKHDYKVKGATTTAQKLSTIKKHGIDAFQINFNPDFSGETMFFNKTDILIVNIPPRRRSDIVEYHTNQAKAIQNEIQKANIKKVLFISSTSVYPELNREVEEGDANNPTKASGQALLVVEDLFLNDSAFECSVLRFAGLIGENRKPGRFFAGKTDLPNGQAPINMIHRDDCIEIIKKIITRDKWGETFNAVASKHPSRQSFYKEAAHKIGLTPPVFNDEMVNFKIISNQKLRKTLQYTFIYDNPLDMLEA